MNIVKPATILIKYLDSLPEAERPLLTYPQTDKILGAMNEFADLQAADMQKLLNEAESFTTVGASCLSCAHMTPEDALVPFTCTHTTSTYHDKKECGSERICVHHYPNSIPDEPEFSLDREDRETLKQDINKYMTFASGYKTLHNRIMFLSYVKRYVDYLIAFPPTGKK